LTRSSRGLSAGRPHAGPVNPPGVRVLEARLAYHDDRASMPNRQHLPADVGVLPRPEFIPECENRVLRCDRKGPVRLLLSEKVFFLPGSELARVSPDLANSGLP
jgi:hypothetical protein